MHNAALRAAGIAATYAALDVEPSALASVVAALHAERAAGNVTIPHKIVMLSLCDVVSDAARTVGAVNTFWVEGGALHGDNTDVRGAAASLARLGARHPIRAALIGAGGAARAAAYSVLGDPAAALTVWNRTPERAAALVRQFGRGRVAEDLPSALAGANVVINATPVGLDDDTMPFVPDDLAPGVPVLDLVYARGGTPLVRAARAGGRPALDGATMLVEQGAAAFVRWFEQEPDRGVMWHALTGSALPPEP